MTITTDIIRELRPADTVALTDSKWLPGTRIVGKVKNIGGVGLALDTFGVGSFTPRLSNYDGEPGERGKYRTVELVKIGTRDLEPVETGEEKYEAEQPGLNRRKLVELASWLGAEKAKKDVGLPSEWNQGSWMGRMTDTRGGDYITASRPDGLEGVLPENVPDNWCGTTACAAGHVALASGGKFAVYSVDSGTYEPAELVTEDVLNRGGWDADTIIDPSSGERRAVRSYAQEQLGLDDEQSQRLFAGENSYDRMMELLAEFIKKATPRKVTLRRGPGREERLRAAIAAALPQPGVTQPDEWAKGRYERGTRVTFDGKVYEATAGPTTCSWMEPSADPECWKPVNEDGLSIGTITGGTLTVNTASPF